jgi:hypothetical protein
MTLRGALLFARYAYPPNSLGYCGPADSAALLDYADAGTVDPGLADLASRFEGAWPYLRLIAGCNGITDPLHERVVHAYWVGNSLLDAVDVASLGPFLTDRFRRRAGRLWTPISEAVDRGGLPHHNLHVMAVYPWVGLMRAGHDGPEPLMVLDRCRIRSGTVIAIDGETARVRTDSLLWDGNMVVPGPPREEQVLVAFRGKRLVPELQTGNHVSLHWDWVCDRLSRSDVNALRHYTMRAMKATGAVDLTPA